MMIVLRSARVCTRGAEIEDDCGISQLLEFTLKRRKCRRSGLVGDRKALANMPGFLHFVDQNYGKIFSGILLSPKYYISAVKVSLYVEKTRGLAKTSKIFHLDHVGAGDVHATKEANDCGQRPVYPRAGIETGISLTPFGSKVHDSLLRN